MKASFRKTVRILTRDPLTVGPAFYGVSTHEGRIVWACTHVHPTRKRAIGCARRHNDETPKARRAQLRHLRATWKPQEAFVPTNEEDGRPMLSRTFIENFLQCVQYQDDRSPEAAFGTAVHAAIHAYYQLCIASGEESMLAEIDRIVRDAFFASPTGNEPRRYEEARDLVRNFVASRPADLQSLHVVEGRPCLEFDMLADCGWFWLTGRADRIDRVDGEDPDDAPRVLRVRDIKSGWDPEARARKIPGQPDNPYPAPIPHNFQRQTYAMCAFLDPRLNARLEAVETVIDYPRSRREPEIITYERGELDNWWEDIKWALLQRWQQRSGPPTGCAACEYCAARATCGGAALSARAKPENIEQATTLAEEIVRIRAMANTKARALQSYMRGQRMVVFGGLEIGYAPPRKQRWVASDPLGIVNSLKAKGYNGEAVMVTWVAPDKVPDKEKAALVEANVARWEPGDIEWRLRKAGSEDGES